MPSASFVRFDRWDGALDDAKGGHVYLDIYKIAGIVDTTGGSERVEGKVYRTTIRADGMSYDVRHHIQDVLVSIDRIYNPDNYKSKEETKT